MQNFLSQKFQGIFSRLTGKHQLTEKNISQAVQEVREAFLEADVSYPVVKVLIDSIKEKALGKKVLGAIKPGQHSSKLYTMSWSLSWEAIRLLSTCLPISLFS